MKKVLILCTGNSCRSIMAEALINAKLERCIQAYSSGVKASGKVHPYAQELLEEHDMWREEYHSKTLDTMMYIEYDLIVTVCDNAQENCPVFPKAIKTIHIGFADPDGKDYVAFIDTMMEIETRLLPIVEAELC
ncbi:arsenate reductase ArsC [Sulfurimonas sp. MAG313]|nr:arsenate reductase ArsC [Sulfurimonas sp. MAG313]MDF1879747.1 arsenate reductase ArsC [Sulfurimonas sp. MAG313]